MENDAAVYRDIINDANHIYTLFHRFYEGDRMNKPHFFRSTVHFIAIELLNYLQFFFRKQTQLRQGINLNTSVYKKQC